MFALSGKCFHPSRQFWDCGRWKSDSLWNFSIVGCQWTVDCLLGCTQVATFIRQSFTQAQSSHSYTQSQKKHTIYSFPCDLGSRSGLIGPTLPVEPRRQRPRVMLKRRPSDLGVHTRKRRRRRWPGQGHIFGPTAGSVTPGDVCDLHSSPKRKTTSEKLRFFWRRVYSPPWHPID